MKNTWIKKIIAYVVAVGILLTSIGSMPIAHARILEDSPNTDGILLVYDGFEGENKTPFIEYGGGTGWARNWEVQMNAGQGYEIANSDPLTYSNLLTSGNYATGGYNYYTAGRTIDVYTEPLSDWLTYNVTSEGSTWTSDVLGKTGETLWASFLMKVQSSGNSQAEIINFNEWWKGDGLAVGKTNEDAQYISMRYGNQKSVSTLPVGSGTVFYLLKYEFLSSTSTRISCWLNPSLDAEPTTEPDMQLTIPEFVGLRTIKWHPGDNEGNGSLDEIRIGTGFRAVAPVTDSRKPVVKARIYADDLSTLDGIEVMGSNLGQTNGFESFASFEYAGNEQTDYLEVSFDNSTVYRYIKVMATNAVKINEVEFFAADGSLITGEPFSTTSLTNHDAEQAFDRDTETYYESDIDTNCYVGLDIGGETKCGTPQFTPEGNKRYEDAISVGITTTTVDAKIYYTIDGSVPSPENGTLYSAPFTIEKNSSVVVRAIAVKDGLMDSDVTTVGYGVNQEPPKVRALKSYSFGNSLTDTFTLGMLNSIAISAGYDQQTMRVMVPGTPTSLFVLNPNTGIGNPWGNPLALQQEPEGFVEKEGSVKASIDRTTGKLVSEVIPGNMYSDKTALEIYAPFDILTTQPYAGHGQSIAVEAACAKLFYEEALKYSPDCEYMVYGQWPERNYSPTRTDNYANGETFRVDYPDEEFTPATTWDEAVENHNRIYDRIADVVSAEFPDKEPIKVIPAGSVLKAWKNAIMNKSIKGWERYEGLSEEELISVMYDKGADTIHMGPLGQYLVSATVFACFYRQNPTGRVTAKADVTLPGSSQTEIMSDEERDEVLQLVWDTCTAYKKSSVYGMGKDLPTVDPTQQPTEEPTEMPTATPAPSATPEVTATPAPSATPEVTATPIIDTTIEPTAEVSGTPIIDVTPTPEVDELQQAKDEAKASLDTLVSLDDYRDAERILLQSYIEETKASIDLCTTVGEVKALFILSKAVIGEVKTDAELTAEENKSAVKKIKFIKKKVKIKVGKKVTLKVKLTPAKGLSKDAKKITWSIDKKGKKVVKFVKSAKQLRGKLKAKIKAVKKGRAKVTCKAPSGKKAVCKIVVK